MTTPFTFEPLYPGSDVERLILGRVVLGHVTARGKRGEWISFLPTRWGRATIFWRPATSLLAARNALIADTMDWLRLAGLRAEGPDTTTPHPDITNIREEREAFPAGNGRTGNQGARGDNPE